MTEKTKRGNVTVEGVIDLSNTSYGVPKQTTAEENGDMETEYWPSELDKDDFTDKQIAVIEAAVEDPTRSVSEVDNIADASHGYAGKVLRKYLPEWYEDVFKSDYAKKRQQSMEASEESSSDAGEDTTKSEKSSDDTLRAIIEAMKATAQSEETVEALEVVGGYV